MIWRMPDGSPMPWPAILPFHFGSNTFGLLGQRGDLGFLDFSVLYQASYWSPSRRDNQRELAELVGVHVRPLYHFDMSMTSG
jgi:hypothetical protein